MRLNHLDERVKCVNKAVGATPGTIIFTSDRDTTNHALAPNEACENEITVELTSLDKALRGESPALLKIDVEGYEPPVLEGAQETLRNPSLKAVFMELNGSGARYGFDETKILELMRRHDFGTFTYDPFSRTLINLEGKNLSSGNTIFVRDKPFVENRIKAAAKVTVLGRQI